MHSTQRMFGCEVQEDGHSSAFWQFGFDGQDHLSLDLETLSWVSAKHVAIGTKRWWEAERCYAEYDKAYLESICLSSLRRYLELGGQSFTRRGKAPWQVVPGSRSQEPSRFTERPWGVRGWLCSPGPESQPASNRFLMQSRTEPRPRALASGGLGSLPTQWSWGVNPLTMGLPYLQVVIKYF